MGVKSMMLGAFWPALVWAAGEHAVWFIHVRGFSPDAPEPDSEAD